MNDLGAGMASGGSVRRKGAKPSKAAKPPGGKVARLQLHLPDSVVKRLGVHCAMKGTSWSAEAARILLQYLAREGRGRELFKDDSSEPLELAG
jgi:plasmid stability protein